MALLSCKLENPLSSPMPELEPGFLEGRVRAAARESPRVLLVLAEDRGGADPLRPPRRRAPGGLREAPRPSALAGRMAAYGGPGIIAVTLAGDPGDGDVLSAAVQGAVSEAQDSGVELSILAQGTLAVPALQAVDALAGPEESPAPAAVAKFIALGTSAERMLERMDGLTLRTLRPRNLSELTAFFQDRGMFRGRAALEIFDGHNAGTVYPGGLLLESSGPLDMDKLADRLVKLLRSGETAFSALDLELVAKLTPKPPPPAWSAPKRRPVPRRRASEAAASPEAEPAGEPSPSLYRRETVLTGRDRPKPEPQAAPRREAKPAKAPAARAIREEPSSKPVSALPGFDAPGRELLAMKPRDAGAPAGRGVSAPPAGLGKPIDEVLAPEGERTPAPTPPAGLEKPIEEMLAPKETARAPAAPPPSSQVAAMGREFSRNDEHDAPFFDCQDRLELSPQALWAEELCVFRMASVFREEHVRYHERLSGRPYVFSLAEKTCMSCPQACPKGFFLQDTDSPSAAHTRECVDHGGCREKEFYDPVKGDCRRRCRSGKIFGGPGQPRACLPK